MQLCSQTDSKTQAGCALQSVEGDRSKWDWEWGYSQPTSKSADLQRHTYQLQQTALCNTIVRGPDHLLAKCGKVATNQGHDRHCWYAALPGSPTLLFKRKVEEVAIQFD